MFIKTGSPEPIIHIVKTSEVIDEIAQEKLKQAKEDLKDAENSVEPSNKSQKA